MVLQTKDLGFAFTDGWLFKNVNIVVNKGDFVAVVGPNGSGKSTLLRLLTNSLTATVGDIELFGISIKKFKDWQKISYISQYPAQQQKNFPVTVAEVVGMGLLSCRKLFKLYLDKEEKLKIQEKLNLVGMWEWKDSLIGSLSGGQRQRVFLARALVGEPQVLFLDEPTSGIDADAKADIYKLLKRLNKENGATIVMISHDMDLAAHNADKVLCLEAGGVCYWGEAHEIMQHRHKGGYYYTCGSVCTNGNA